MTLANNKTLTLYYDETNNVRKLTLRGDQLNIDNDPCRKPTYTFVLAGVATDVETIPLDIDDLKDKLGLLNDGGEIKFSQLVNTRAKHSPELAFKKALASKKMNTFLRTLLDHKFNIHDFSINLIYWVLIDIIDDVIGGANFLLYAQDHKYYKNSLYRLFKFDRQRFISLMSNFKFPEIDDEDARDFLHGVSILLNHAIDELEPKKDVESLNTLQSFIDLERLIKSSIISNDNIDFALTKDGTQFTLHKSMAPFYVMRLKQFPNATHILDIEIEVSKKIDSEYKGDYGVSDIKFHFSDSTSRENPQIQLSDVISGFNRLYYDFAEGIPRSNVEDFISNLTEMELNTAKLFDALRLRSCDTDNLLLYRVVPPQDDQLHAYFWGRIRGEVEAVSLDSTPQTPPPVPLPSY